MNLLEQIHERQLAARLSDRQLAAALDIPPSLWNRIKNLKREPTLNFLRAILRKFPDLKEAVISFLLEGEPGPGATSQSATPPPNMEEPGHGSAGPPSTATQPQAFPPTSAPPPGKPQTAESKQEAPPPSISNPPRDEPGQDLPPGRVLAAGRQGAPAPDSPNAGSPEQGVIVAAPRPATPQADKGPGLPDGQAPGAAGIPPGVRLAQDVPKAECKSCKLDTEDHTIDLKFPSRKGYLKVCVKDYRALQAKGPESARTENGASSPEEGLDAGPGPSACPWYPGWKDTPGNQPAADSKQETPRGDATAACQAHNLEDAGSTPAPATTPGKQQTADSNQQSAVSVQPSASPTPSQSPSPWDEWKKNYPSTRHDSRGRPLGATQRPCSFADLTKKGTCLHYSPYSSNGKGCGGFVQGHKKAGPFRIIYYCEHDPPKEIQEMEKAKLL